MNPQQKLQIQYLLSQYISGNASEREEALLFQFIREENEKGEWQLLLEELMAAEEKQPDYKKEEWQSVIQYILNDQKAVHSILDHTKPIRKIWKRWTVAASIVGLLLVAGYWLIKSERSKVKDEKEIAMMHDIVAPQTNRATITTSDGKTIYLDSAANGTLATQNNITLVKTGDGVISYEPLANSQQPAAISYHTLNNPSGSKVVDITLSDGSHIWLNAGSSLTYPVAFVGKERKVSMTGEAYFEVKHDATKKFIVEANGTTTEVLGTHFNVNAYSDEDAVRVTLLEGSVNVIAGGAKQSITPGQQAVYSANSHKLSANNSADLDQVMAWKNGLFSFDKSDIETVMRELARWYDLEVEYAGPPTKDLFGGDIQRDLPLSQTLNFLKKSQVHFEIEGKKVIVKP